MKRIILITVFLILIMSTFGFVTATPQAFQPATAPQSVIMPQATEASTEVVVTPTVPATTPEPAAQGGAVSSPTPIKAAFIGDPNLPVYQDPTFNAWCTTVKTTSASAKAWEMPADAKPALDNKGTPQLSIPAKSCTFVFTFSQAVPKDTQLLVYDIYNTAWLKLPLQPVDGNANQGYVVIKHLSIVDPPLWETKAKYEVKSGDQSLWLKQIIFYDSNMPTWRCVSNNQPPRKDTGRCDSQIELHPWDAAWGTPGPGGWGHN
jgi:hypothetical protein